MPTFAPFLALGHFPFCLKKVDVSDSDYWSTLGGFKKGDAGSPTALQIENSLINAGKLFWKLYSVSGTLNEFGAIYNLEANADDNGDLGSPGIDWLCATVTNPGLSNERRQWGQEIIKTYAVPSDGFNGMIGSNMRSVQSPNSAFDADIRTRIVRLYNGSTLSESNFVGYGLAAGPLSLITTQASGIQAFYQSSIEQYEITLLSYVDLVGPGPTDAEAAEYVTFSGIPCVCYIFAINVNPANPNFFISPSTQSVGYSGNQTLSIDSMDFYTPTT